MQWTGLLPVLLVTVSTIRSQQCPDKVVSYLVLPDGSPPDLLPRRTNAPVIRKAQTRSECEASCVNTTFEESDDEWRLSRDVIPSHYSLHLDVDVDKFTFNGTVEITIEPQKTTESITLHSDGLTIGQSEISYLLYNIYPDKWGDVWSTTEDKDYLTVTFHLSKPLEAWRKYIFKIEFNGEIREDLLGFYRSSYKVGDETRWLATTQFEPTHARRAFPCFDEPNLKAIFDISITHDKKYSALSNMPISKSISENNRVTDIFKSTPKMSTYLIAFIISDLKSLKTRDPISSIWANEDYIKNASYSQKLGVGTVRAMEDFTKIRFSLPKIDHVAIPDFNAGAMENWGLITYRDYLLIQTNESTTPIKEFIPGVIAHEVAHQWFGNLVTLDWWSYTWLNEGFATFFENYVTEIVTEGKFANWQQFIPSKFQIALELDGNPATSIPMTSKVSTPQEIADKFDQISYGKGGCILRMISELLTLNKFREGIRNYLWKKQYSNAKPDNLFEQWEKVSSGSLPKDIKFTDFAKSWTEQDGVPVVTATRDYENGQITFTQQRYYDKKPECPCDYDRLWWIPLTWISPQNNSDLDKFEPQAWLRGDIKDEKLVQNTTIKPQHWLLLNLRSVGYFRVNYDTKNWLLLARSLEANPQQIPEQNKAQIINDAFLLASSGHLDFAVALGTLNFLPKERNPSVWMSATRIISRLVDQIGPTEAYPLLEEFWQKALTGVYQTVGLKVAPNEMHAKSILRFYVAPYACLFGVQQCIADAEANLRQHVADPNSIHPDVISPTVCGAVRGANEETFWNIRKRATTVGRKDIQQAIISALGRCQPDNNLVKLHLEDTLKDGTIFPKNLTKTAIQQVIVAPAKFGVAFEFMKANFDRLMNVLGRNNTTELVTTLIKRVRTAYHHQQVYPFTPCLREDIVFAIYVRVIFAINLLRMLSALGRMEDFIVSDWLVSVVEKLSDPQKVKDELQASKSNTEWNTLHLFDVTDWLAASLGREPPEIIPPPVSPPPTPTGKPVDGSNGVLVRAGPLIIALSIVLPFIF